MKPKPYIESILILTGTKNAPIASEFFKKYFFSKTKSLDALQGRKELNKIWVKDRALIDELEAIVDQRVAAYSKKDVDLSSQLKEQEWEFISKQSKLGEEFNLYRNRSSGVFENTRVYLAFKEQSV